MATIKSIEEKAKAYDEALKKAKDMLSYKEVRQEDIEYLFPELAESEDERIGLLNYLYDVHDDDEERARWIAWLEKQGEHANFLSKIQVGDKVTRNEDGILVNLSQLKRVAKKDEKQGEQKLAWSEEDESNLDYLIDFCNGYYNGNKPVLTESTARSLSNWLYRLKSGEIQLKTYSNLGWTGEEDAVLHNACEFIRHRMHSNGNIGGMDYKVLYQKLKSLKERYTWKPSEEQMEVLKILVDTSKGFDHSKILESLYNDLKKLREE